MQTPPPCSKPLLVTWWIRSHLLVPHRHTPLHQGSKPTPKHGFPLLRPEPLSVYHRLSGTQIPCVICIFPSLFCSPLESQYSSSPEEGGGSCQERRSVLDERERGARVTLSPTATGRLPGPRTAVTGRLLNVPGSVNVEERNRLVHVMTHVLLVSFLSNR